MNAHFPPPTIRDRTSREHCDRLLIWREDLLSDAARNDYGPADFERVAAAAHMAAERCSDEARETTDMGLRLALWSIAGRYALRARVCLARARELRS